ncbi:MAG: FtsX-like permease family protein, partial [Gemmatimonadota bacterium]|nr:FtsX-like permease family protein [Gemmatimonadota bacterium]
VLLAVFGARELLALVPGSLPRADDVAIDRTVLAATIATAAVVGIVFGLVTALHARRASVAETLHGGTRSTAGASRAAGRRLLVAVEIALSVMLLVGAGLMASSFVRLERVNPGFDPSHSVAADVLLPVGPRFNPVRDGPAWSRFFAELTGRLVTTPGVEAVGAVSSLPLSGAFESGGFAIEGRPPRPAGQGLSAQYSVIAGDYFRAMGIKLLAGRAFDGRDRGDSAAIPVIIVSQAFATTHFPGESAIGKRLRSGFDFTGSTREIVGIVDNVHQIGLGQAAEPMMYVPESQMPYPFLTLVLRAPGDALGAVPGARAALKSLDPTIALDKVRRLDDLLAQSLARQRFNLVLLTAFALSALALALVGLYGVIALSVGQRRREIGVRLALGAQTRDVVRLVLGEAARVTAAGIVAGLAGALAVSRLMRALLFDVSATDAMVYGAAAVIVAVVALAATLLPARRATRVAPMDALRLE